MNELAKWNLLLQSGSTLAMVGLIWFVQIVHYPLFAGVGREQFVRYESDHQRLTTLVVVPLMLVELATAIALIWMRPDGVPWQTVTAGLVLLGMIWLVTFTVQVPQHASLMSGFDADTQRRLVLGNWIRTIAWSARGVLVLSVVSQSIGSPSS